MSRIIVVSATEKELADFTASGPPPSGWYNRGRHEVMTAFTGIGPVAATFAIQELVHAHRPELIIQGGICGYYPHSGLAVGQTVLVESEKLADLGAVFPDGFRDIFPDNRIIFNPYDYVLPYKRAAGFTVSSGATRNLPAGIAAEVESMEGYALFYTCTRMEIPFLEIRTVSNKVSVDRSGWNIPLATKNLAAALNDIVDRIP